MPSLRSAELRRAALAALGLDPCGVLLLGVGRLSAEKRWDVVLRAAGECGRRLPVGLLLVGDGSKRQKLQMIAAQYRNVEVLPPILTSFRETNPHVIIEMMMSNVVHGCEAETFCLVAAEARASGIPLIVPDRGGAADQLVDGGGRTYRAGREQSLEQAIEWFVNRGPELQRAAAVRASHPRTIDEHFADLFARYEMLAQQPAAQSVARLVGRSALPQLDALPEVALARSRMS